MLLKHFKQRFSTESVKIVFGRMTDAFRMTEIGHECHRDDYTVCVPPFLFSNTVRVCSTVHVLRVCAIMAQ